MFHTFPNPKEIQLAEDVVGCLSDTEVHVFKVKFNDGQHRDDSGGLRSISLYSVSSEVSSVCSDHHLDPLSSLFLDASAGGGGGGCVGGGGSVSGSDEGSVKVVDGANTLRQAINILMHILHTVMLFTLTAILPKSPVPFYIQGDQCDGQKAA